VLAFGEGGEHARARSGHGRIVARRVGGRTELAVSQASSPVRLVRPTFPGSPSAAVCVVTFGAGLVDGDAISLDVVVEDGATLVLFTQASTKVFRGRARQSLQARVEDGGTLVSLPDPVAPFAGADYEQRVDVVLEGERARCVLLDGVTSGRPAYGERWAFARVDLRTTVRRGARTIVHDALRLDARDGSIARRMDRFESLVTLASVGAPAVAEAIRGSDVIERDVVAATSVRADVAIARIAATAPERAIAAARTRLRNLPEMDAVDPFASRS
jgi:urease accessory protein